METDPVCPTCGKPGLCGAAIRVDGKWYRCDVHDPYYHKGIEGRTDTYNHSHNKGQIVWRKSGKYHARSDGLKGYVPLEDLQQSGPHTLPNAPFRVIQ